MSRSSVKSSEAEDLSHRKCWCWKWCYFGAGSIFAVLCITAARWADSSKWPSEPVFSGPVPIATEGESDENVPVLLNAREADRWGYANQQGEFVIAPDYDAASPLVHGVGVVLREEKFGYIAFDGRAVSGLVFDAAAPFDGGDARVGMETRASRLAGRLLGGLYEDRRFVYRYINQYGQYMTP